MRVILLQDVPRLGKKGSIVQVSEGYARNYLLPRGLAEPATEGKVREIERVTAARARKERRAEEQARALAERLQHMVVRVPARVGEGGKLFGSVSTRDIAAALKKEGVEVDRKQLHIQEPVKALGRYRVQARLHPGTQASFWVEVIRDDS
ncbi:MAG: 50S ribosomal protein L9 [Desulfotomaculales bacterium]